MSKKRYIPYLFLLPSVAGVSLFVVLPFLDVVRRSFYDGMGKQWVGLENYVQLFQNSAFLLAWNNTKRFLLTCIPTLILLSFFLALFLHWGKKKEEFFKTTFLIPMAIPVSSVVLVWRLLFHSNGLLNHWIISLGGEKMDFLYSEKVFYVFFFSYLWRNTGYNIILWISGLKEINPALYEAAHVDGAGKWKSFYYITMPLMKPNLYMVIVMAVIHSFKAFREVYLISGSYPHESIYMLQNVLNNWFQSLDIQKISTAAVLLTVVILLFIMVLGRAMKES